MAINNNYSNKDKNNYFRKKKIAEKESLPIDSVISKDI